MRPRVSSSAHPWVLRSQMIGSKYKKERTVLFALVVDTSNLFVVVLGHIDGVARASSAGTKSGSSARSLVLLTMLAPVSRCARLEDQLQLDDEANSEIADRYTTGSSARHVVAVGDLPTSSVSAPQLVLQ